MSFDTPISLHSMSVEFDAMSGRSAPGHSRNDSLSVSRQFESMFLQMLIKQMRQTGSEEGLYPGDTSDTYGVLFDQFIADHMSQGRGVGIATFIEQNSGPDELRVATR